MSTQRLSIQRGYQPGSLGRVVQLHGQYYAATWDFGVFFEAKVAAELAEFLTRYDSQRDGYWLASYNGKVHGSLTVDAHAAQELGAHLRWFVLSDALRGQGTGRALMSAALDWCRQCGYGRAYLWTFAGLHAARHLYDAFGFELTEECEGEQWGTRVTEQRFDLRL